VGDTFKVSPRYYANWVRGNAIAEGEGLLRLINKELSKH